MTFRIATFTTDFGLEDAYVAEMKGALLAALGELDAGRFITLVDVTHILPRHAVRSAAEMVAGLSAAFPAETVHLVVVDPGVGSSRRPLVVGAAGQWFVGPDNGVFTEVLSAADVVIAIDPRHRRRDGGGSRVFDGRDLFAPAAAHLLAGRDAGKLGPAVSDPVLLPPARLERGERSLTGEVLMVDHFGNLRTSIPAREVPSEGRISSAAARDLELRRAYADAPIGALVAVTGSDGRIEIAVREGSAAERLGVGLGAEVRVVW